MHRAATRIQVDRLFRIPSEPVSDLHSHLCRTCFPHRRMSRKTSRPQSLAQRSTTDWQECFHLHECQNSQGEQHFSALSWVYTGVFVCMVRQPPGNGPFLPSGQRSGWKRWFLGRRAGIRIGWSLWRTACGRPVPTSDSFACSDTAFLPVFPEWVPFLYETPGCERPKRRETSSRAFAKARPPTTATDVFANRKILPIRTAFYHVLWDVFCRFLWRTLYFYCTIDKKGSYNDHRCSFLLWIVALFSVVAPSHIPPPHFAPHRSLWNPSGAAVWG